MPETEQGSGEIEKNRGFDSLEDPSLPFRDAEGEQNQRQ